MARTVLPHEGRWAAAMLYGIGAGGLTVVAVTAAITGEWELALLGSVAALLFWFRTGVELYRGNR